MAVHVRVPGAGGAWVEVAEHAWPALFRVATDDDRVARALDELDGASLELLGPIEERGRMRLSEVTSMRWRPDLADPAAALRYATTLARAWLVLVDSEDDPQVSVWEKALPQAAAQAGRALGFDEACATLAAVGVALPA
jgi:hypothetical protein